MANFYSGTGCYTCRADTTADYVWLKWNHAAFTNATNTTYQWNDPWPYWANSTGYTTNQTWEIWIDSLPRRIARMEPYGTVEMTEEEKRQWEEQRAARAAAREEQARKTAEAKQRARELLLAALDDEQRAEYESKAQFHVTSSKGHRYCIKHGRQHNVFRLNEQGHAVEEYCGHVGEAVPDEDNVLAQALLIQADEDAFLAVANRRLLATGY